MTSLRLRMLEDMQIRNLAVNTQESTLRTLLQSVTGAVGAGADSYLSGLPDEKASRRTITSTVDLPSRKLGLTVAQIVAQERAYAAQ